MTRAGMMALLDGSGISTTGQRGYHILFNLSMRRLIVFGPREGTQQTFVLFDEWLPDAGSLPTAQALALIVNRFFTSHGPATAKDFAGWSGLTIADTNAGLSANSETLTSLTVDRTEYWMPREVASRLQNDPDAFTATGGVHLLPAFDEFVLGYKDRTAILHVDHSGLIAPGNNGVFKPTVVVDGQVAGVWKRLTKRGVVSLEATPFATFTADDEPAIARAAERYLEFTAGIR